MSTTHDIGTCVLDDEHPLWCVNAQITGLLEGDGASEDHLGVLQFLVSTGLPLGTAQRIHRAICCYERDTKPLGPVIGDAAAKLSQHRAAPPELTAAIDDALGLIELPPIRISKELHAKLLKACERSGQIVQAEVRDMIKLGATIVEAMPPLQPKHLPSLSPAAAWPYAKPPVVFNPTPRGPGTMPYNFDVPIECRARQLYADDTSPIGFLATLISFYRLPAEMQNHWRDKARETT